MADFGKMRRGVSAQVICFYVPSPAWSSHLGPKLSDHLLVLDGNLDVLRSSVARPRNHRQLQSPQGIRRGGFCLSALRKMKQLAQIPRDIQPDAVWRLRVR